MQSPGVTDCTPCNRSPKGVVSTITGMEDLLSFSVIKLDVVVGDIHLNEPSICWLRITK
jgi:hypothetical protein